MVNLHENEFRTYEGPEHANVNRTPGAVLAGQCARHTVIDTQEQRCLVEVNFALGGAAPFFAASLPTTRDQLVDLEDLWGSDGVVLRERLLEAVTPDEKLKAVEAALLAHLVRPSGPDRAVEFAVAAFERGSLRVRRGVSPRTAAPEVCAALRRPRGPNSQAVFACTSPPAGAASGRGGRPGELGAGGRSARLLRSGALDQRLSRVD
jgi:hypothetical protein